MKILSADFITSAAAGGRTDGIPRDTIAQVAFAGRSNVGKSTLLNALVRKKVARTSAEPGKTRLANIFRVAVEGGPGGPGGWSVYLVDLPGYGYARGGADAAQELAAVAAAYFGAKVPDPSQGSRLGSGTLDGQGSRLGSGTLDAHGSRLGSGTVDGHGPRLGSGTVGTLLLVDSRHPGLTADVQAHQWLSSVCAMTHVVATKVDKLSRAERVRNLRELERIFGNRPLPVSASDGEGMDELWRLIARLARPTT